MAQHDMKCPHCGGIIQPERPPASPHVLKNYIAAVEEPLTSPTTENVRAVRQPEKQSNPADPFIELAEAAARQRRLPAFNSYSRQAIDCKPEDRRMYALRARLSEEADAFANLVWATPVWYLYTPRQKKAQLRQHFYALNTALQFSIPRQREELINQIARHLLRQAVDLLTERAQLRCQKRLLGRTFKGHYHKSDLLPARDFCDAIKRVDDQVCPLEHERLKQAIRTEALSLPRKLARRLTRY